MTKRALSCEWKLIAKGFLPSLFIWFESVLESFGQDIVKYQWCEFCPYLCGVKLRGMVISHLLLCPCKLPLVWASAKKRRSWKSKAAVSNRRVNKSLWYNQPRYKHQCYCVVDCILQISFSSFLIVQLTFVKNQKHFNQFTMSLLFCVILFYIIFLPLYLPLSEFVNTGGTI